MSGWPEGLARGVPSFAWCVLVVAGTAILVWGERHASVDGVLAKQPLASNHLLLAGDLATEPLAGRYLVASGGVAAGTRLRPGDVSDHPVPPKAPPVRLLLALPVGWDLVRAGLNAGSTASLCGKAATLALVDVEVVQCDRAGVGATCSALLAVPRAAAADLAAKGMKDDAAVADLHLAAGDLDGACRAQP